MTKLKRAISFATAAAISLSLCLSVNAVGVPETLTKENIYPEKVTRIIDWDNMGDITNETPLFNSDGEIVAYCLECTSGYLIYDMNGDIVEYSPTEMSPYANIDSKAYYGGPLNYITEVNESLIDINTNIKVDSFDFETVNDTIDYNENINNKNSFSMTVSTLGLSNGTGTTVNKLSGTTRPLNYNVAPLNSCGSLAATIVLFYLYDYVDSGYLKSTYAKDPKKTFDTLRQRIEPNQNGTSPEELFDGLINNLEYVSNKTGMTVTMNDQIDPWGETRYIIITQKCPVIIDLTEDAPTYKNHWVVAYGTVACYYNNKLVDKLFEINDGWGNNNKRINHKYTEGLMYFM